MHCMGRITNGGQEYYKGFAGYEIPSIPQYSYGQDNSSSTTQMVTSIFNFGLGALTFATRCYAADPTRTSGGGGGKTSSSNSPTITSTSNNITKEQVQTILNKYGAVNSSIENGGEYSAVEMHLKMKEAELESKENELETLNQEQIKKYDEAKKNYEDSKVAHDKAVAEATRLTNENTALTTENKTLTTTITNLKTQITTLQNSPNKDTNEVKNEIQRLTKEITKLKEKQEANTKKIENNDIAKNKLNVNELKSTMDTKETLMNNAKTADTEKADAIRKDIESLKTTISTTKADLKTLKDYYGHNLDEHKDKDVEHLSKIIKNWTKADDKDKEKMTKEIDGFIDVYNASGKNNQKVDFFIEHYKDWKNKQIKPDPTKPSSPPKTSPQEKNDSTNTERKLRPWE